MSYGVMFPNWTQTFQKEVSQMEDHKLPCAVLNGGLSVNLNHLKSKSDQDTVKCHL